MNEGQFKWINSQDRFDHSNLEPNVMYYDLHDNNVCV